ncbi:MAG: SDR family NAD(P)-dependent oxidoreductase [Acidobacteria bacterium]|nr:SDR family NAD(P)-dependent oxidoreductase [Acidobacteriota bacterium]
MKKALVTGGASGIGAALVELLRAEGYEVTALDRTPGPGIHVADAADVPYDLYDLVFLNAGIIGQPGPAWAAGDDAVWWVNWQAPRRALQILIPGWLAAGHAGRIVFTASLAALIPMPFSTDYCASKAALLSLAETLLHELRAAGSAIGVSIAIPSFTQSNLAIGLSGEFAAQFKDFVDRGAPTADVARAIYDGALGGQFLIVTHPQSMEGVVPRLESLLTGAEPARPSGRRMDALFQTKY